MQVSKKMQGLVMRFDFKLIVDALNGKGSGGLLMDVCNPTQSQQAARQIQFLGNVIDSPNAFRFLHHPLMLPMYNYARDIRIIFELNDIQFEQARDIINHLGIDLFAPELIELSQYAVNPSSELDKKWLNARYFGFFQRLPQGILQSVLLPMLDDKTLGRLMQTCRFFIEPCHFALLKDKALLVLDQGLWPLVRDKGFNRDQPLESQLEKIKSSLLSNSDSITDNLSFSPFYRDILDIYVLLQSGIGRDEIMEKFPEMGTLYMDPQFILERPLFAQKRLQRYLHSLDRVEDDAIGVALQYLDVQTLGRFMQTSKRMKQIAMKVAFERRMKLLAPRLEEIAEAIMFQWGHDDSEGQFQAFTRLTDFLVPALNEYDPSWIVDHLNLEELYLTYYLNNPKAHWNPFDEDGPPVYKESPAIKRKRLIVRYSYGLFRHYKAPSLKNFRGLLDLPQHNLRDLCKAALFLSEDQIREFAMNFKNIMNGLDVDLQYFILKAFSLRGDLSPSSLYYYAHDLLNASKERQKIKKIKLLSPIRKSPPHESRSCVIQ